MVLWSAFRGSAVSVFALGRPGPAVKHHHGSMIQPAAARHIEYEYER